MSNCQSSMANANMSTLAMFPLIRINTSGAMNGGVPQYIKKSFSVKRDARPKSIITARLRSSKRMLSALISK